MGYINSGLIYLLSYLLACLFIYLFTSNVRRCPHLTNTPNADVRSREPNGSNRGENSILCHFRQ